MHLGFDPISFGILFEIGLISPPVGMNLFVLKTLLPEVRTGTVFRGVLPFMVADVLRLARTIMAKAPIPIAMAKSALESGAQSDLTTAMALETPSTVTCFLTEDAREVRADGGAPQTWTRR